MWLGRILKASSRKAGTDMLCNVFHVALDKNMCSRCQQLVRQCRKFCLHAIPYSMHQVIYSLRTLCAWLAMPCKCFRTVHQCVRGSQHCQAAMLLFAHIHTTHIANLSTHTATNQCNFDHARKSIWYCADSWTRGPDATLPHRHVRLTSHQHHEV